MTTATADIARVVERVIGDEFGEGARIVSVSVKEDRDPYGSEILAVRVVYDAKEDRLDPRTVAGMVRHIRSRLLDDLCEERFPILSFIAKPEAHSEAA